MLFLLMSKHKEQLASPSLQQILQQVIDLQAFGPATQLNDPCWLRLTEVSNLVRI